MMRDPRLDPLHRPAVRLPLCAFLLLSALAGSAASAREEEPLLDEALKQSMAVINDAFRGCKPGLLTSLMPQGSKVLVSLERFEGNPGYYGRDQVYYILQQMFHGLKTLSFEVRPQSGVAGSRARSKQGSRLAHCIASWRYARQDGPETETQMLFVLSQKDARWNLVQVREAR